MTIKKSPLINSLIDQKTMQSKYVMTNTIKNISNVGNVTTYGIAAQDKTLYQHIAIDDISTDKEFVESIVEKLNSCDVSHVHFFDIIEDMIP